MFVPRRKHITSSLRIQQVNGNFRFAQQDNAIRRFVAIILYIIHRPAYYKTRATPVTGRGGL
jgi:hypothetical protein